MGFRAREGIVVHRCLKKRRVNGVWWFYQGGDNCYAPGWVDQERVLGRVVHVRKGSRTVSTVHRPIGGRLFIVVLRACGAGAQVLRMLRKTVGDRCMESENRGVLYWTLQRASALHRRATRAIFLYELALRDR